MAPRSKRCIAIDDGTSMGILRLRGLSMNVHLVSIVGGSGSGKTWLAQRLFEEFPRDATRISLDDFYRDLSDLPMVEREQANFDHPEAIDWPLFHETLMRLRRGQFDDLPEYDFERHVRRPARKAGQPARLVLLDGLWLLHEPDLRELYSLSIFVECPEAVRLARRLERDTQERGRSPESVTAQFTRHVAPMHNRFVAPQRAHAHLVVQAHQPEAGMAEVRKALHRLLNGQQAAEA